ncbi:MAG: GNAT family N-acetyltransferase [Ferruginibacter sp.]
MLELNFDPFPVLLTERLIMRKVSMEDIEQMFELRSNPDAMKYINRPLVKSIDDIKPLLEKMNDNTQRIQWAICFKNHDRVIGTIGYHIIEKDHYRAELGYMLHPDFWRKGLMNEAIPAVINYGFNEIRLHSIEARINPANEASSKILLKHKFKKEGFFRESYFFEGVFYDSEIYGLLKADVY